jgi:hypothetical protein
MQRDEWISNRAYAIWEDSGHPHGNDQAHWEQAEREWADRGEDQANASGSAANWDDEEA